MAVDYNKLVKFLKSNKDASQRAAADNQGASIGELPMLTFCKAKVEAGIVAKATPANAATVKRLRDKENDRWEMIAARTGLSVAKVKELYGGEEAAKASTTGRGRPAGGSTPAKTGRAGQRGSGGKTQTAAQKKAQTGKGAQARRGTVVRNTSGRRGKAGNPS